MDNLLARFAVEGSKVSRFNKIVLPQLFEPHCKEGVLLLSVQRIDELEFREIKELGIEVVKERRGARNLHGWAEFTMNLLDDIAENLEYNIDNLEIEHDPPPSLHSNLKGWPDKLEDRIDLKRELARRSKSVVLERKIPVKDD